MLQHKTLDVDVCVVGGGMSGMCAAIAAARNGANTMLIHDRPVLGGNASSEIRMWICGAHGEHNKETGILEEIQLENCYRNPMGNYSIWDSVLYEKVAFQPNLDFMLNTSVCDAHAENGRIQSVKAWQLTSQTWFTVHAKHFIDCSGDSILAPLVGADWTSGREARDAFDEDIEPAKADDKTMGNTLLIQLRRTDEPQPFTPPRWAYKFKRPEDIPNRIQGVNAHNFWWLELGGLNDTIADAEAIRDQLYKVAYGVWDYIKNYAPERDQSENWALEWLGSLPGKRENRRYCGAHILTQNDIRAGGEFDDTVCYGGWSMDDHHPAGLLYPGKPTIFHPAPSPYGIPYRSLYSRNISNLLFAGRNISVTHAALSSTRVMATCALIGQAAGTAAALAVASDCDPAQVNVRTLQSMLMADDVWLPGTTRPPADLTTAADMPTILRDGFDRDRKDATHKLKAELGKPIEMTWDSPVDIGALRLVFNSNLRDVKRMPCSYPLKARDHAVPFQMIKAYRIDVQSNDGSWETVFHDDCNYQRLVYAPVGATTRAIRLIPEASWGADDAQLFSMDAHTERTGNIPAVSDGPAFSEVVAQMPAKDLAEPDSGLEDNDRTSHTPA